MKTLIVSLGPYQARGMDAWHDHGAGMTYAAAKNAGCDVTFLDMKALRSDEELKLRLRGYDLVGFGLKSSYYNIGMRVIAAAKAAGAKVIVGGYHATAAPQELIENPNVDWIFHGESEITFPKFLQSPSAYEREIWGEKTVNLDDLPIMDRSIFANTIEDCGGWWYGGRKRMISVISARGCPYKCSFCQPIEDNHFGTLRRKSVDALIAELREVKRLYNPECVMIHDDTFLLNRKWIEEFIEKYPEIGLPFWAAGRADGIVKYADLMPRLVQIGWELVSVGFESGSQRILDKISKGTTIAENLEAAKIIRAAGGKIYANYILGFPFETKEDIQATAKMADAINAEMPSWAFFTPYPGCESGEECIRNGWSLLDRNHYDRCPSGRKVKFVDYDYLNRVLQGFRETPDKLLCDIVIPSYENEDLTIKCLQAIGRSTRENSYRVIWVDNGSKNTRRVEAEIQKLPHLYILNKTNQGFVGAINAGLRVSTATFVCLLNNDTEVTPGWLDKLLAILCANPEIGIIGPLTGYAEVGPDSHHSLMLHDKLLPPDASTWGVQRCNEELEKAYPGRTYNTDFVAFLCAVIRRDVIDRVGLLDTNYDMGMWDDLDYNLAARKLGYKTVLALDTCIYHRGRSTFNLIEKKEKFNVSALLKKNRAYLDSKWNPEEITRLTKS